MNYFVFFLIKNRENFTNKFSYLHKIKFIDYDI